MAIWEGKGMEKRNRTRDGDRRDIERRNSMYKKKKEEA